MLPPNGAGTIVPMFFALAAASSPVSLAAVFSNVYSRGIWMTSNSPVSTALPQRADGAGGDDDVRDQTLRLQLVQTFECSPGPEYFGHVLLVTRIVQQQQRQLL